MNVFDAAILLILLAAILIGVSTGALPQLGGLAGAIAGAAIAIGGLPLVQDPLDAVPPDLKAFVVLAGILLLVGLGEAIGSALGRRAAVRLGGGVLDSADRVLGGVVGAGQAFLVIWLMGGLIAAGPTRFLATQAQTSFVVRTMSRFLPPPTEFAAELAHLLRGTGIPELFVGLEPLPAPDVERPSDPAAEAIADPAVPSTVRVSAATCQFQSSGTGFAIAPEYVVTNAHVVAGATGIRVRGTSSGLRDAVAVWFDPELDVAVLWVNGLSARPLRFATSDPTRGALGATIGFPHGGDLEVEPAAVAGAYTATGRDIYGTGRVSRAILELRAAIEQGDSGGPLVLRDGTVGGVVFAEARTDDNAGYALTATSVATAVAPAVGRTGPVDTGSCIH